MSSAQGELSPGARVDRYEIIGHLGGGGFGVVYAARHTHLNQTVALKLLRPDLAGTAEAVERFFREARAAAAVGNPHIVEVFDCGMTHTQQPFLSMELLEGTTLDKLLGRGAPLAVERALDVALQLLEGLGAAHAAGITHRDLKPANIFLCRGDAVGEGDFVKILDFGASKVQAQALQKALTRTGAWIGTPAYMSPEQFLGARDVDHRADLYAVSVVLFEMLADTLPVQASTAAEMATRVLSSPPRDLSGLRPGIAPALCAAIEQGLAKDPEARYSDASAFAAALRQAGGLPPAEASSDWMLRSTQASQPGEAPPAVSASTAGSSAAAAAGAVVASAPGVVAPPSVAPPPDPAAAAAPSAMVAAAPPVSAALPPSNIAAVSPKPKRHFLAVAAIALVGGMIGGGMVSGTIAVVTALSEPGDSPAAPAGGASVVEGGAAGTNQTHSGTIPHPGAQVRYPLQVTTGRTFSIFVQGQGVDPTVRLLDQGGAQLGFDDDGGGGLNSRLMLHLQPGQYIVEVAGFGDSTGAFTCTIN